MIKSVLIQNLQSHKESELEFDKGVNIIVGPSDSGKTAIIRALRWLVWNRPSGEVLRSHWGGQTKVTIDTEDAIITRLRDKENKYILGDSHFEAIKTDVPKEVQEALNMSEINIQRQLDSPFLISETPGEVAKHFNRIARLDQIDSGLQNVNRWITQITKVLEFKREERDRYKEQAKQFDHLEKFEAEVEVAEAMESNRNSIANSVALLKRLLTTYAQVEEDIAKQTAITKLEAPVNKILKLYESVQEVNTTYEAVRQLIRKIEVIDEKITDIQSLLNLEDAVTTILDLYSKLNDVNTRKNDIVKAINKINSVDVQLNKENDAFSTKTKKFKDNMPSVCPLCGTKLKNKEQ